MSESFLQSIGLHSDWGVTMEALMQAQHKTIDTEPPFTRVSIYDDPSGACVGFAQVGEQSPLEAFTVHGVGEHTVIAWQVFPGIANIDLLDENEELLTRFLAYVDDPQMYPIYDLDNVDEVPLYEGYQLSAIANEVEVFDSVEKWQQHQEKLGNDPLMLSPRFIASPWLFALYQGQAQPNEVNPIAVFRAVVEDVEVVTNQLTGKQWYKAVADCGFKCALALPITTEPAPKPGSVVDGDALLGGTTGIWEVSG